MPRPWNRKGGTVRAARSGRHGQQGRASLVISRTREHQRHRGCAASCIAMAVGEDHVWTTVFSKLKPDERPHASHSSRCSALAAQCDRRTRPGIWWTRSSPRLRDCDETQCHNGRTTGLLLAASSLPRSVDSSSTGFASLRLVVTPAARFE